MKPLDLILPKLKRVHRRGNQIEAQCPAHDDDDPSLAVKENDDGTVLIHCHAGCQPEAICAAWGISVADLFPRNSVVKKRGKRIIVATYDYRDRDGTLMHQTVRYEGKKFSQRRPDGSGGWIWSLKDHPRLLYHLPELAAASADNRIIIVEGEKDADNLARLGLLATTCPQGAGQWKHVSDDSVLEGHPITIIADKDDTGREHCCDVTKHLHGRVREIRILEMPGEAKDVSEWLEAGGTKEDLIKLIETASLHEPGAAAKKQTSTPPSDAPVIILGPDEHRVIDETVPALAKDPDLYQRGGMLVRVERRRLRSGGGWYETVPIVQVPRPNLRDRITRCAQLFRKGEHDETNPAHPPDWLVAGVEARGRWEGVRELAAVTRVPILRPNGSILQQPGYDPETCVLYIPTVVFPSISPDVDIDDATAAIVRLSEVVEDFRFAGDEHRSAFLAGLLTPLARHAFEGPAPLFLFDANVRGAGKGLLADVIGCTVDGYPMPVSSYSDDPEEMRKKITSIVMAGDSVVLLDNIAGAFGNESLDRALTSTRWKDRVLKTNTQVDLPLCTVWFGTGNNVVVGADTARRIVHVRLDVLEERPEERCDFKHPDLRLWVKQQRPALLCAALTVLRAYFNAGCPPHGLRAFGSFEGWSSVVREALVWAGQPDPCLTRVTLMESADLMASVLAELVAGWSACFGTNAVTIHHVLQTIDAEFQHTDPAMREAAAALRGAIEGLLNLPHGKQPSARALGNKLKGIQRRVIGGVMLDVDREAGKTRFGVPWRLFPAKPCDSGDSCDSVSGQRGVGGKEGQR